MADHILLLDSDKVDVVASQTLSCLSMVVRCVGVALPDGFLLVALLPVGSFGLEHFLQLILGQTANPKLVHR